MHRACPRRPRLTAEFTPALAHTPEASNRSDGPSEATNTSAGGPGSRTSSVRGAGVAGPRRSNRCSTTQRRSVLARTMATELARRMAHAEPERFAAELGEAHAAAAGEEGELSEGEIA